MAKILLPKSESSSRFPINELIDKIKLVKNNRETKCSADFECIKSSLFMQLARKDKKRKMKSIATINEMEIF